MHSSWEKKKRRKEEEEEEDREAEKPPFVISVVEGRRGKGENRGFRKNEKKIEALIKDLKMRFTHI